MLTKTYAFLSLSVEHARLHDLFVSAQRLLHISSENRQHFDIASLASVVDQFVGLEAIYRTRKLEHYLIPVIRKMTREADSLLDDLESLRAVECRMLDSIQELLHQAQAQELEATPELYSAIDEYCNYLQARLEKEEKELLPLAQRIISSEIWFAMGTEFLSMDADGRQDAEHRRPRRQDAGESQYGAIHV